MEARTAISSLHVPGGRARQNARIPRPRVKPVRASADDFEERPVADDAAARIEAMLAASEKSATEKRVASQSVVGLYAQTQNAQKDKVG